MSIRTLIKQNRLKLNAESFKCANESNQLLFQANHTGPIKKINVNPNFNQVCSLSNYNNAAVAIPTMKTALDSSLYPLVDADHVETPTINFVDGTVATISTAYYNFTKIGKIINIYARIELSSCTTSGGLLGLNLITMPYGLTTLPGRIIPGSYNLYTPDLDKPAILAVNMGTLNGGLFATSVLEANYSADTVTIFVNWCFDI